jgi:PhzF family phenazine biosynthesis protein
MLELAFRILNVFTVAGQRLSGNPLAVFEDGSALEGDQMRALARQFNLSETTFILPTEEKTATARVRIFTPMFEMPFAGHPTLGTAHVVRDLLRTGDQVTLEMKAGLVQVAAFGDAWTLRTARKTETKAPSSNRAEIADMLGLTSECIAGDPLWVDTGAEQLVIPLRSAKDVARAKPPAELLSMHGFSTKRNASMAYVWAREDAGNVVARFFFLVNGGVVEDPATGSACANLGGYLVKTGAPLPVHVTVSQGDAVSRPSKLNLHVDAQGGIFVGGEVVEIGRGRIIL